MQPIWEKLGYLARTVTDDGRELIVFHWAPTEWDQALDHYTVRITYPLEHSGPGDRESVEKTLLANGFATEKFMNENYLIDYKTTDRGGKNVVQVQLHKNKIPTRYHFAIQQYIDSAVFESLSTLTTEEYQPGKPSDIDVWQLATRAPGGKLGTVSISFGIWSLFPDRRT